MRPTAASASKTHEKPVSPPRKASAKAPASNALHKGKKKVEEIASKAKAAVTSEHDDEQKENSHPADDDAAKASSTADQVIEPATANGAAETAIEAATPIQEADSSAAELQTPHFQGETLR